MPEEQPVPVTARLSSRFYEKLGDAAANELVDWLNAVDAEFRSELRDQNDRNWDRFRDHLDRQAAELRAELDRAVAELRAEFRTAIADLRAELKADIAALRVEFHAELHSAFTAQLRWMFTFWVTTLLAIAGLKLL